ncbi:FKBP-type peptidyl-prolyl cis-trans isomerase [Candidatus Saccharibacteria bacterium]|nr:FKBP-type peptidyl-prolyl cis-trans isomerase [Candidatus Saccharibacteria bacterium]
MKDKLRRAGWLFLVLLFAGTGLGIGVVAFWQATHQKQETSSVINTDNQPSQQLKGTQLSGFTPIAHADSLQATDIQVGSGAEAKPGAIVTVQYTGAVAATGVIFESSLDSGRPATFGLNQVIKGWTDGVPGMKVNGQRRLLIPASLAYGANPPPGSGIPANADLVFDIILLDVK